MAVAGASISEARPTAALAFEENLLSEIPGLPLLSVIEKYSKVLFRILRPVFLP
jgi:hypothetical protein